MPKTRITNTVVRASDACVARLQKTGRSGEAKPFLRRWVVRHNVPDRDRQKVIRRAEELFATDVTVRQLGQEVQDLLSDERRRLRQAIEAEPRESGIRTLDAIRRSYPVDSDRRSTFRPIQSKTRLVLRRRSKSGRMRKTRNKE